MRSLKTLLTISFVLGLIFIGMGDAFLPKPLSTISKNTRTRINNILLGFTPDPKIKNPNRDLSRQAEEAEERAAGKRDRLVGD